jgi:hypothetical protein
MAAEALALHIQGMIEDELVVPEPSTLDSLKGDPNMLGAVPVDLGEGDRRRLTSHKTCINGG